METRKIILILLTILIVGPLVFVGTCFPIGLLGMNISSSSLLPILGIIIGLALALWAVIVISKKIAKK